MGIKGLFGFGQARDKSVRNYSNGEYTFNFGRSTSGRSVNKMTAMQTTVVYACVRILSEAVASLLSGDGEMILAGLASFAQEESRSMSENNKWSIQKKFERGEIQSYYISENHEPIVSPKV